ncbi:serine hydrolase domain-containing protein [Streptomyces sp. SID13031]|uniref:serine hydrolase domain-containing protein n=1 Tax=Streptomyces sp. SID13031 TaxID=2706046 RepID=UPI0013CD3C98|nr:serine hydrolase domain-containing protein [Streptomyces sp. SID13031]NEA36547.1 beta-lactamase family protein [Streptomyces sp. SID13031]
MTPDQQLVLSKAMAGFVASGALPGAVMAISSTAGDWVEAVGRTGPDGGPLRPDAVVRISSMTKPITAALTHQLAADGVLALTDPITRWLPELADRRVVRRLDGPVDDTVPAEQEITVEDLLTMRLGFGFAFEVDSCPVAELAVARGLGMGPPLPSGVRHTPDEWIEQFATLPLMEQPGRHWRYELAYPVLGVLLARAAAMPLPRLMAERLLQPLGMTDTGFAVPEHARDRLIPCFMSGDDGPVLFDGTDDSDWLAPPVFPHAAGGLVSTATDYLRFGRLLLDGGAGLLTEEAIAELSTDQLTEEQRNGPSAAIFLDGEGWGHGVQVRLDPGLPRRYGWGGGLGTTWYNFPDHGVTAVLLTQHLPPLAEPILHFWRTLDELLGAA